MLKKKKKFCEFITRLDLVDKFRNDHPNQAEIEGVRIVGAVGCSILVILTRLLVRRVDLDPLCCSRFNGLVYLAPRLI